MKYEKDRIKVSADRRKVQHLRLRHKRLEPSEVVRRETQRALQLALRPASSPGGRNAVCMAILAVPGVIIGVAASSGTPSRNTRPIPTPAVLHACP
jgi:hypothetical protein